MRTACRVAGPMSETAPLSTCKLPRARSRQWSPGPSSTRSRLPLRRLRGHAGNPSAGTAPGPSIRSVELLQGRLAKGVMDRVCREGDGLFPSPTEIKLSCSCPDWADMCKHVAAALYGVGARLDEEPALLFELRGVDRSERSPPAGPADHRAAAAANACSPTTTSPRFSASTLPRPARRPWAEAARKKGRPHRAGRAGRAGSSRRSRAGRGAKATVYRAKAPAGSAPAKTLSEGDCGKGQRRSCEADQR